MFLYLCRSLILGSSVSLALASLCYHHISHQATTSLQNRPSGAPFTRITLHGSLRPLTARTHCHRSSRSEQ